MTAPDRLARTLIKPLANRGRPHMTMPSQDTFERLNGEFVLESRGVIDVKGKGEMPV